VALVRLVGLAEGHALLRAAVGRVALHARRAQLAARDARERREREERARRHAGIYLVLLG